MSRIPNAFPDAATLRTVLDLAALAPSAENSQPWHWQVDSAGLHLDADWSRRLGDTRSDRGDVLLGCGAVLHHCAVALAATGWQPRIRRFRDGRRLASFDMIEARPPAAAIELADAIPRRRSDRRNYVDSAIPAVTLELLLIRAARSGVHLGVVPRDRWIRTNDGRIRLSYGHRQDNGGLSSAGDGALLVLATDTDDDYARMRAGEATSNVLLSATALGLASCPFTEPLRDQRARLALACDLFDGEAHPQALIRLGLAPSDGSALPQVPRRSVAETTTWA